MQRAIDAASRAGVPDSMIWGRAPELTQCRERQAEVDKLVANIEKARLVQTNGSPPMCC